MAPDAHAPFDPALPHPLDQTVQGETALPIYRRKLDSPITRDLKDYQIIRELGRGSSGIVYKAVHKKLGRKTAIKMLHPEYFKHDAMLEQFRREARNIARIKHENIASVYDFVEKSGRYYIIMELVNGRSLAQVILEEKLSEKETLQMMRGLLEGVRYSHQKDILHLDLKPSNILINEYNEPVIVDFGLSRFGSDPESRFNKQLLGTPHYMAPEQFIRGNKLVNHASDLYSLGIIFFQMLSGKIPFSGETFDKVRQAVLVEDPPTLSRMNPRISRELEAIIGKLIRKNPTARYASAQTVLDDLNRYSRGEPVKAMKQGWLKHLRVWVGHNRAVSFLTLLVLLVAGAFGLYFHHKKHQETPQWRTIFTEFFERGHENRWQGYRGLTQSSLSPLDADDLQDIFGKRIHSASFRGDQDLILVPTQSFQPNLRLAFKWTVHSQQDSRFGFFTHGSVDTQKWGYIFIWQKDQLSLHRDTLHSAPLWTGFYHFDGRRVYNLEASIIDGVIALHINGEPVINFQDFQRDKFTRDTKIGFFAQRVDLEIDQVRVSELETALRITPLDIASRLVQLGRPEEAVEEYSRVIAKHMPHAIATEAYYLRGLTYLQLGQFERALGDFNTLLGLPLAQPLAGQAYFQKGLCLIAMDAVAEGCVAFDQAIKSSAHASMKANVVNGVVGAAMEKLNPPNPRAIRQAEDLFRYLMSLDVPYKTSYIALPKTIILYYFDQGEYAKCIQNLDRMKNHYANHREIVTFSLWKKGRTFLEMAARQTRDDSRRLDYQNLASACFETILSFYPDIPLYNYFACEELATLHRSRKEYRRAIEYEHRMLHIKKNADLLFVL